AKNGFACSALARLADRLSIPVIASGGCGNMQHFADVFSIGHADAALAASVFHFNEIKINDLKIFLHNQNISIRL
ncbi:MAG: HisA/HisF-related TIM barrel protein, partial [Bacteroidales bacterium]|nr:HisA/HisF-related TIM barrel protein [Bacteroidales bacterium]